MTAKKGTRPFTTNESKASEKLLRQVINRVLKEPEFSDFSLEKSYSVNKLYNDIAATNVNGKDSMTNPDAGVLKYKDRVVGLGDNKYQHTQQNACERVGLYTMDAIAYDLSPKRVFIVFAGSGFMPHNKSGCVGNTTGKMIVRCKHHNTTLVNPTEREIFSTYRRYLRQIMKEEG